MQASKYGYLLLLGVACAMPACFKTDAGDDDDDDNGGASGESSGGSGGKGGSSSGGTTSSGGSGGSSAGTNSTGGSSGGSDSSGGTGGSSGGAPGVCSADDVELSSVCPSGQVGQFDDPTCNTFWRCYFAYSCSNTGTSCDTCISTLVDAVAGADCVDASSAEYLAEACTQQSQAIPGCEL